MKGKVDLGGIWTQNAKSRNKYRKAFFRQSNDSANRSPYQSSTEIDIIDYICPYICGFVSILEIIIIVKFVHYY